MDPETDVVSLEFRLDDNQGGYVWVEAAGTDQRDTDVGGLVISIRDISERKERENVIEAQNRRLERLRGSSPTTSRRRWRPPRNTSSYSNSNSKSRTGPSKTR